MDNLEFAKERLGSAQRITISTVIEEWNIGEVERLLDWCGEQGFVFAAQSAQKIAGNLLRDKSLRKISRTGRRCTARFRLARESAICSGMCCRTIT
jgi:hypothetical protein